MRLKTTFRPMHTGTLYRETGFTETGRPVYSDPVSMRFNVIRLRNQTRETSVRTDQSGSQGRALEDVYDGRILVHPEIEPMMGQVCDIKGVTFKIDEVQPKWAMDTVLSHYQVDLVLA